MKQLINQYENNGDVTEAKIVKKILKAEGRRNQFRRIKYYVGKEKSALKCLIVPPYKHPTRPNENEIFIIRKKEMEEILIERNSIHLHQAHESEVVQSGCVAEIAEEMVKSQIVNGEYSTRKNVAFNTLIQGFKRRSKSKTNVVEVEDFTKVCKRAKSGKISAHSIISYGLLKCFSDSKIMMNFLSKFYTKIIQNRISLQRWKRAVAVMLEKGKGPRLDKLRIIQLICSDLQSLMQNCLIPAANTVVEEGKLNLSQYARKQSTTMSALVEKRLILESAILTRDDSVWVVSDMTACYDRHVREIGELALRSHGVNEDVSATLMAMLGAMETTMKTGFGESRKSYKSTSEMVHYGTGQGNVVSVFVCQFGTSVIFYLLDKEFVG